MKERSIAVVLDHYMQRGGTERVVDEFARIFDAPIYAGIVDEDVVPSDVDVREVFGDAWYTHLLADSSDARNILYPFLWQRVPQLAEYDILIQTGDNTAWYVPLDEQITLRYVNSPRNLVYDRFQRRDYNILQTTFAFFFRAFYFSTVPFPDRYLANSELVKRRIRRYWGVDDVSVLYPPIDIDSYQSGTHDEFYLSYSRLDHSKNFDSMISAFEGLDEELIIGGTGPLRERIEDRVKGLDNVHYQGYLSESVKRDLLGAAKALVFAAENEDFGMVPIEAFASGTPVIGIRDGFTKYQIIDGKNGFLFNRGELPDAINKFESKGVEWDSQEIIEHGRQYDIDQFESSIRNHVAEAVEDAGIQ